MNITATTAKSTSGTSRIRHRIGAIVFAAIVASSGLGAISAAPVAAAATPTFGIASVCFKAPTPVGWLPYDRPVILEAWFNNSWQQVGSVVLPNSSGCIRQALPAGYYWHYRVYHYERGAGTYVGTSNWAFVTAGGSHNLGTVWLYRFPG